MRRPTSTNVERAEVASGPNSILFGVGATGGLVSLSGKKATLNRDRLTVKSVIGSWDYTRVETDYNKILVPKQLSLRLLGLYHNSQDWRKYAFNDQRRFTGAVTYKPFRTTTINASFEKGKIENNIRIPWNAYDDVTRWEAAGRQVFDGAASTATGTTSLGTNNRFTFDEIGGRVYNYRGELRSNGLFGSATLLPPSVVPYEINLTGPAGKRFQSVSSHQVTISQELPRRVALELAYFHNEADVFVNSITTDGQGLSFRADPNRTIADPNGVPVLNPNAGRYQFDNQWQQERNVSSNDVVRLSAAWQVDLGRWFGRHRLAGMFENLRKENRKRPTSEILVDQNNIPISNAAVPETAANALFRRHYVDYGNFDTYFVSNLEIPLTPFTYDAAPTGAATSGPRQMQSRFVARSGLSGGDRDTNTYMLASQSSWFKERLITTLGYRVDHLDYTNVRSARITDPNDPRVTSGARLLNEFDFGPTPDEQSFKSSTFTAGAVIKPLRRVSLFVNTSRNTGLPNFNRTILPDGLTAPPSDGVDNSVGFMFDFFGDDRYFVRTTFYKTEQVNNAGINPDGLGVRSNALGAVALEEIIDGFYQAGLLTREQRDEQAVPYNSTTSDITTRGVEVEFVANPTRNLSVRFSYTKSERERGDFFNEIFAFWDAKAPEWRAMAAGNAALTQLIETNIAEKDQLLNAQFDRQRGPFGNRPHKASGNARYTFTEGALRGVTAGGGLRYQGAPFIGYDLSADREYFGNETLFGDAFVAYRTRLPGTKVPLTVQLNVKNISNSYRANTGKYNNNFTGKYRVYLAEPRAYRLTTTLEF
jgi:iron complex outermembrane recepter protein